MDYYALLDIAMELGYRLAMSGAETYRVEESVTRVMHAYGIDAQVFAIPNCLHVSIESAEGKPMTRMRRIGQHGNNLDAVERYNALSRRLCLEVPEPKEAKKWLNDTQNAIKQYSIPVNLIGNFLIGCGFAVLFGGTLTDSLCSGVCGLLVGVVNLIMERLKANNLFRIIIASFFAAFLAYFADAFHIADNADTAIIGALMILVPGLLFTNALRDIIYGDTNSGINRIVQVLLVAVAIALGTGAALNASNKLWGVSESAPLNNPLLLEAFASLIGCIGFALIVNIHGKGSILCVIGGMITWVCYRLVHRAGCSDIMAYFIATTLASLYAETMARIRKYPAISYLLISIFPLIPGAGVYYTVNFAATGDMTRFAHEGTHTIAIAGAIAVGILLVSTIFRFISTAHSKH